jgi:APA family basic amino acid/polyamine antiporter
MAREADLPRWLAAARPRFKVPHRTELVLAAVICLVISIADLRGPSVFPPSGS